MDFPADPGAVASAAAAFAIERLGHVGFATWRCGTTLPRALAGADELTHDVWRRRVQEALRPQLAAAWPGRTWERIFPDVIVEARPDGGPSGSGGPGATPAKVTITPLLYAGRYRKLSRDLSQTVFHCPLCRRREGGPSVTCTACGGAGRLVREAVESFVRPAVQRASRGLRASFHGCGREDVDVRMLGTGRPFVVSVARPLVRAFDGAALAREVETRSAGRVLLSELRAVRRDEARRITGGHGTKIYRAVVAPLAGAQIPADAAALLAPLSGALLAQRTPERVEKNRADSVRERRVLALEVESAAPARLVLVLRTEAGTYVKELVSGDGGRTTPSVAHALGVPCVCAELDVLGVETPSATTAP